VAFFFSQLRQKFTLSTLLPHDTKSNVRIVFLDISVRSFITPLFIHELIFTAFSYLGGERSVRRVWCVPMCISYHGLTALSGPGSPFYWGFTITLRHTTLGRTPLDEWLARRRDLYLTTHNTHNRQTSMSLGGIRTRNPKNREAADPRLRPHGHWDQHN
jgi:hypothetical protein